MTDTGNPNTLGLRNWLAGALAVPRDDGNARHIDELSDCRVAATEGGAFLSSLLDILERARRHLQDIPNAQWRYLLLVAPLEASGQVTLSTNNVWSDLRLLHEPPSLYLLRCEDIFGHACEEYRRPLVCPVAKPFGFTTVFRSFRPGEYVNQDCEFSNNIYFLVERSSI